MTLIDLVAGLAAALLLLTAGWLFGVRRGRADRERLRTLVFEQAREIETGRASADADADRAQRNLTATIERAIAPLVERDRLSDDLARLDTGEGRRRDLGLLLDRIAEVGNFTTVVLCDEEGLPLAANDKAQAVERHAANSSLVLLLADRMGAGDQAMPLSIMIHDEANTTTLCRLFRVQDRRLTLSAVTSGARLTPTALDPALVKLVGMLSPTA